MSRVFTILWFLTALLLPELARAQGVGGFVSPGPLAQPHAEFDSSPTGCAKCHSPDLPAGSPQKCTNCHESVMKQISSYTGFHKDKGQTCRGCHPDHRGRDCELIQIEESGF